MAGSAVGDDHIADEYAPQFSHGRALGTTHPAAKAEEEGNVDKVTHGDVADGDVFQYGAVYRLEGDSSTLLNHAVGDGDVTEPAIAFRSELDTPIAGNLEIRGEGLVGGVQHRAFFVAAGYITVGDGHVVGGPRKSKAVRIFQTDAIIPGRVDAAIRDPHVAAAIDIDAVAIGIDLQVVDGEVVDASGQDGEMPAVQDGEIAQGHVAAILQADGFVTNSGRQRVAISAAQALAPNQALTFDGNVFQIFAPDQAVVPVAVAKVLKLVPGIGLGRIIAAARAFRRRVRCEMVAPGSRYKVMWLFRWIE